MVEALEKYLETAKAAGCPRDQVLNFVAGGYVAFPEMLPFHAAARECDGHDGPDSVGLGGTRGPGKSHAALAQAGLDDCQRVDGLKVLFLRKVKLAAAEAFEDLISKVIGTLGDYVPSRNRVEFPNGSRILIGGFNIESDIDKYLGIEYDEIVLEEATQLSEKKIQLIGGSLRSTKPGWKARMYLTTNADGIGLRYFKEKYVFPYREKRETYTRFFQGHYKDNPLLGAEYHRFLDGLTGALRKAWRDCDWDAFEGMAFPNWNHDKHIIEPFPIPDHWVKWRSVDWGYASPWTCGWFTKEPDSGRVIMYRETYDVQLTDRQQAVKIKDETPPNEKINLTFADPSMWGRKRAGEHVTTSVDEYAKEGIVLTPGDNHRLNGKRKIDRLLGDLPDGQPGFQVVHTCENFIRTFPYLVFDKINPEDVDTEMEDHSYDMLKYGLTNVRTASAQPPRAKRPPLARVRL